MPKVINLDTGMDFSTSFLWLTMENGWHQNTVSIGSHLGNM